MSRSDGPRADTNADDAPEPDDNPEAGGSPAADDAPLPGEVEETGQPPVGSRRKVVLISAAVVVALAVAGVVVYLLTRDDSTHKADGPAVPTIEGSAPPNASAAPTAPASQPPDMSRSSSPAPVSGADAGAAESVAEQAASAITNADAAALVQLSCDPNAVGADDTLPENAKVEVIGEPEITGDTASIDVRVTVPGAEPAEVPMPLIKQDGRWCIPS